jgi:CRP-like cAMP-binding protein
LELITFLSQHFTLDDYQKETINNAFDYQEHQKGTVFLTPNNTSINVIFLEEGFYRTFYYKDDKSVTQHFWAENTFNCPLESVFYNETAPYGWEALEKCRVRSISFLKFKTILESIDYTNKFTTKILIDMIKIFMDRLNSIQLINAEKRYEDLINNHPDIILRASLGDIASYIGITQQRLSVIRTKNKKFKI